MATNKPPIGMNEINEIARRYLVPPMVENLYRTPDWFKSLPPSRWRRMTWPLRRRWSEARMRVGVAWRALQGDFPDY